MGRDPAFRGIEDKPTLSSHTWLYWIVVSVVLSVPHASLALPYDAIYAFGDSLTDQGNTLTLARSGRVPGLQVQPLPPYYSGRSSNGPIWLEYLAGSLGLPEPIASLLGGTNFAYAGAETGTTPLHTANAIDLLGAMGQLAQFRQAVPSPSPDALYTIWIGANDLYENFYALGAGQSVDLAADEDLAARNAAAFVGQLASLGAKNVLLVTVPDIGLSPIITQNYPIYIGAAAAAANAYNVELVSLVSQIASEKGVALTVLDTYSLLQFAVSDPGRFGLRDAADPCWTGDFTGRNGTVCGDPAAYLFWDHYHPTTAAHAQIALQAEAALVGVPEPGSAALLAAVLGVSSLVMLCTALDRTKRGSETS